MRECVTEHKAQFSHYGPAFVMPFKLEQQLLAAGIYYTLSIFSLRVRHKSMTQMK